MKSFYLCYPGAWLLLLLSQVLVHADSNWINLDGGSFGNSSNWSNGVPGTSDWAKFGPNKSDPSDEDTYTVTLDANRTISGLHFAEGDKSHVILDLGGQALTLNSTTANNSALYVNSAPDHARTLTLLNGTLTAGQARIGISSTGVEESRLIVSNGAIYQANGETRIGNSSGNAYLRVEGTGRVQTIGFVYPG